MSFGFSVGDFIATGKLIKDLVSAFRHDSASSYFELVLELDGLKRALDEIEHLKCPPDQEPALNSIKVAALMCQHPLNEFATKLKRYESLGLSHTDRPRERLMRTRRKIQWATSMEDDVAQLRAKAASFRAERQAEEHSQLQKRVNQISSEIIGSREDINRYGSLVARSASLLGHLSDIVAQGFGVKLESLLELVTNVWNSNLQIVALIAQLQATAPRPDICHTWFQEPARFEDALGRILPIPSEYAMSVVVQIYRADLAVATST
ncbi:hypothetical protein DL765_009707 [Monosporascus sp. GIB2]|nr:hypothetical protein DL765_009707 [Monosporascus sp. GIB2]